MLPSFIGLVNSSPLVVFLPVKSLPANSSASKQVVRLWFYSTEASSA